MSDAVLRMSALPAIAPASRSLRFLIDLKVGFAAHRCSVGGRANEQLIAGAPGLDMPSGSEDHFTTGAHWLPTPH